MSVAHGDFTLLAENYRHRPGYSTDVLKLLAHHAGAQRKPFTVADIGAGTGKLTENLVELGLSGVAVEPNDAMREQALKSSVSTSHFRWSKGKAEETLLPANSADWILMGSSFHWTDTAMALAEFQRVLKPGGHFTALWNPRDIKNSEIEPAVENYIRSLVPNLNRKSSGNSDFTAELETTLLSSGKFRDVIYIEGCHQVVMSADRYRGVWNSVNDIRVQAGEEKFKKIVGFVDSQLKGRKTVRMSYRTRSWTAKVVHI